MSVQLLLLGEDVTNNNTSNLLHGSTYRVQCIVEDGNIDYTIQITQGGNILSTSPNEKSYKDTSLRTDKRDHCVLQKTRFTTATISAWKADNSTVNCDVTPPKNAPFTNLKAYFKPVFPEGEWVQSLVYCTVLLIIVYSEI